MRIGAMTRHRALLESDAARASASRSSPTPSASSPTRSCATAARSAARSARPIRPRTSPRSAPRSTRERRHPRPRRRARRRHARVPPRPVRDGGRRRPRCSPRSASRCTPSAGSAYEKVERRAGDWAVAAAGAALRLDGGAIADGRASRSPPSARERHAPERRGRRCAAARRPRSCSPRPARSPPRSADPSTDQRGVGRVQAPPRAASSPSRALRRAAARALREEA